LKLATGTAVWKKSSYCGTGQCVEVANTGDLLAVRDSKDPGGPVLSFGHDAWRSFLADLSRERLRAS